MKPELNVAIVGAGPYGLSIAAHLAEAGVDHRIFGTPMGMWRDNMPPGMHLKSYGESSDLFDPHSELTLARYCSARGIPYDDSLVPVRLDTFVAYGTAFQERFVPHLERKQLVGLRPAAAGAFELELDDGERFIARNVVLATGVMAYLHKPAQLAHLPKATFSHSSDWGPLDTLRGKKVAVLGSGSSALDLAALLSAGIADVSIIARGSRLEFQTAPTVGKGTTLGSLKRAILSPPAKGLGSGWIMRLSGSPQLFRQLPDGMRRHIVATTLGPCGSHCIREQVEKHVSVKLGRSIERVEEIGSRLRLTTAGASGTRETLECDHLIAATGYHVDIKRLSFIGRDLAQRIRTADGSPILNASSESSVPGLFFVGLPAARTFGPAMRFAMGAVYPAQHLARRFKAAKRISSVDQLRPAQV